MVGHSTFQFLASFGAGSAGGALAGLFGVGGGIVLVPLLALMLGIGQHQAQGLSLAALLFPNTLPAVLHYKKRGVPLRWPLAFSLIMAFVPGIWIGARIANLIPPFPLRMAFVGFLMLLALKTLLQKKGTAFESAGNPPWLPGLPIGLVGGICGGLLGIGGGVVMIPLLVLFLKMPQHEAQLTSMLVLLPPVGIPGVIVYFTAKAQPIPWLLILGLALGFQLGAFFGARVATRLSGSHLQKLFAGVAVLLALLLLVK